MIKQESSKWIKQLKPGFQTFYWQAGYGVFSVSPQQLDRVTRYIANQESHHQKMGFQDEYRLILKAYGVKGDERYLWD